MALKRSLGVHEEFPLLSNEDKHFYEELFSLLSGNTTDLQENIEQGYLSLTSQINIFLRMLSFQNSNIFMLGKYLKISTQHAALSNGE